MGDTRAYLVHAGGLRLLTHDHVADGPPGSKRQVARDLGRRDLVGDWVETGRARVARGDLVVLASDGLTDVVAEPDLVAEFRRLRADGSSADDIATRLVGMALAGGGPDNVTVVAVRVGAFSRRAPRSPGYLLPAVLGVVGVALVGFGLTRPPVRALFGGGEPMADHIPGEVNGALDLKIAEAADVGSAMVTEVRRGGALRLAGKELQGGDWTVRVADGGSFELVRSVVDVNRQLRVEVSPGGELLLRDVRVANGRVVVHAEDGARVRLHHVLLAEPGSLDKVGPGAAGVVTDEVGVVEAPDPSEAPPQPPSRALTP